MNFTVIGHFLGKTTVRMYLRSVDEENDDDDDRSLHEIALVSDRRRPSLRQFSKSIQFMVLRAIKI